MRLVKRECIMDDIEVWPHDRVEKYQWHKLRTLLNYAYRNLAFYRQRFDEAGITPRSLSGPEDLSCLPILHKRDIMQLRENSKSFNTGMEMLGNDRHATLGMTSGTTGTDFLYCSSRWRRYQGGRLMRAYRWAGLCHGMRMMLTIPAWHCWAAEESYLAQSMGIAGIVPWGTFLPRFASNFLDAVIDLQPEFISMFLPMLYSLQAECRRRELPLRQAFTGVRCILVAGAPLTPTARRSVQEETGAEIYAGAGTTEGLIAMECDQHNGYHLFIDTCYVEVVEPSTGKPLPEGEKGLLVLTAFNPYGTVYIRFDTGDLGRINPEPCPCGRTWPLLEIYDRLDNTFYVLGKRLAPYDVRICVDEVRELTSLPFSVIRQTKPASFLWLALQRPPIVSLECIEVELRAMLRRKLEMEVKLEWVEQLPARWKGVSIIEEKDWRGTSG